MNAYPISLGQGGPVFSAREGQTLLQAAEQAGLVLPSSCRNGTCRSCLCRAEGPVRHLIEWPGLSLEEKREGWILPCVAVALGPLVLLR